MKTVSIVIPCRNEQRYIARCLDSIIADPYNKDLLSVYVCDGLSDDGTRDIIESYCKKYPFIHYLANEQKTTPYALNLGLRKSDADIKIILGAHAEIVPGFIDKCLHAFTLGENIVCTGGIIENIPENQTAEIISMAQSSPFGVGNAHFRTGGKSGYVDTVAFGAYTKEIFEKIGYFDEDLVRNQDDEFNFRIIKNGYRIFLYPDIRSRYYVRGSYLKLFRQYYQYGYWKVFVNLKHQTITTVRQLVPMFFVLFLGSSLILGILFPFTIVFSLMLSGLYLLLAIAFAAKKTRNPKRMCSVAYVFFLLHLSYGTGYLEGILNFYFLRKKPKKSSNNLTR